MTALRDTIVDAAGVLTGPVVERLTLVVEKAGKPGLAMTKHAGELLDGVALDLAIRLNDAWEAESATSAETIVDLLATASRAVGAVREQHVTELAWTGPPSSEFEALSTREALLTVIKAAKEELFLASFVGYLVADVEKAIKERLEAGVEVRMLLETPGEAASNIGSSGWAHYQHLQEAGWKILGLRWPLDQRPSNDSATQHAKVAVADDRAMLITSANLTDKALTHNMELGVLIRGGPLPGAVRRHFRDLHARSVISSII